MSYVAAPARVALVGNPNSGKTALFNALTGSRRRSPTTPGSPSSARRVWR
jgi:Fe2+ transport system protein B